MIFGLSRAELGLVLFIIGLVYAAVWVPRATEKIARALAMRSGRATNPPAPHPSATNVTVPKEKGRP